MFDQHIINHMIKTLKERKDIGAVRRLEPLYINFEALLSILKERDLSKDTIDHINKGIDEINAFDASNVAMKRKIRQVRYTILRLLEKNHKLVVKSHYRNLWMSIGLGAFGTPIGVALGFSQGNMGLIGIGLPVGMVIGIAIGARMDIKAKVEGRQLDIEVV